ncbi:hypothetical protein GGE08_001587 [Muricauda sp. ARW1Y1]|nr:hypothetical protein [Muricauda sp. ARW1Y1]
MIDELTQLIDRYPFHFYIILAFGYALGAICNCLFMRIAKHFCQEKK